MTGNALAIVAESNRRGITLAIRGGKLIFRPKDRMTPELFQRLKARKIEVLTILAMSESLPSDGGGDPDSDDAAEAHRWPGGRPTWVDGIMAGPDAKAAQPEDTGSLGYRRHLIAIRRIAAEKGSRPNQNLLDNIRHMT